MQRLTLTYCLLIGLTCISLKAQDKQFPEGLRKLTSQEMMDLGANQPEGLPQYGPNGTLWSEEKIKEVNESMEYIAEYYANTDGVVVAIKYRPFTEQELEMIAQFKARQKQMAALIGTEAQDFEVTDMKGNTIKLSELRGSVVAINFWFVGCKPCILEMPELNEIVTDFEGQNVKFVAIALDKEASIIKFKEKYQFDYDIVPAGRSVANLYNISGYPTHCIVDQEGNIAYFKSGYSPTTATEITNTLEGLLHD